MMTLSLSDSRGVSGEQMLVFVVNCCLKPGGYGKYGNTRTNSRQWGANTETRETSLVVEVLDLGQG